MDRYDRPDYDGPARDEAVESVAARWWASGGNDEYHDALEIFLLDRPTEAPDLIAAMVRTVPAGSSISYIGTGPLESMSHANHEPAEITELLLSATISTEECIAILSGVWPDFLIEWGVAEAFRSSIPPDRIAWLLNAEAPGRSEKL